MYLYFETEQKKFLLTQPETEKEALKYIHKFCADRNYKVYYVRSWNRTDDYGNKFTRYDVGSHTQFFCLSEQEIIEPAE